MNTVQAVFYVQAANLHRRCGNGHLRGVSLPKIRDHLPHIGRQRAREPEFFARHRVHEAEFCGMEHHPRGGRLILKPVPSR